VVKHRVVMLLGMDIGQIVRESERPVYVERVEEMGIPYTIQVTVILQAADPVH